MYISNIIKLSILYTAEFINIEGEKTKSNIKPKSPNAFPQLQS